MSASCLRVGSMHHTGFGFVIENASIKTDIKYWPHWSLDTYARQTYYWTPEWQEGEREADEDIKHGRIVEFDDVEDATRWLNS